MTNVLKRILQPSIFLTTISFSEWFKQQSAHLMTPEKIHKYKNSFIFRHLVSTRPHWTISIIFRSAIKNNIFNKKTQWQEDLKNKEWIVLAPAEECQLFENKIYSCDGWKILYFLLFQQICISKNFAPLLSSSVFIILSLQSA